MRKIQLNSKRNNHTIIHLLLIVFCIAPFVLHSQNQIIITGIIKDQVTQLPIEGVNIQLQNTYSGTTTNTQGIFKLRVKSLPAILTITHVTYFGKQIIVTQSQADSLMILLSPVIITLGETEITDEPYNIFKGKHQEVIDYDFLDTNLLILVYNFNKNRHELIVTNEYYDTLSIKDVSYLKKPGQIFKDCTGSCHLLTRDTAYQVYYDDKLLHLSHPTHWEKFYEILGNCLFETGTHYAFRSKNSKLLKVEFAELTRQDISLQQNLTGNDSWDYLFFLMDKNTHQRIILDVVNENGKQQDAIDHTIFLFEESMTKRYFEDILRFAKMAYFKPAFQSLKLLNDTIYYFNQLKSRIDIYSDNLLLIDSVNVDFHNRKNWKPVIITDKTKNKAYTIFTVGAKYSLAEINLQDGSVTEVAKIDKLFPLNIKVNNGYLYFLYNNINSIWEKRQLFQGELIFGY